ncbi:MAG: hypothetical protein KDA99_06420, partial [Planctomycetales bacterium]|nr:hypothetical protein [Planctomycetales bacterium]
MSLQSAENLVISGGTLRVGSGGGSIEGNLSLTTPSASLVSRTGMLTVNGALQLSAGILRAQSGGHLLFPSLTTFTATNSGGRFEAEGSGSKIDLANLTGFSGGTGIGTVVSASGGALVDIPQISSITVGATTFDAIGAGSTIDLSGLTNFSADNFASNRRLRAEQGARIISPNLATLGRVRVELGGTTSSIDLGKVTKVDEATLQAFAGGQMAIPMTTTIAGTTSGSSLLSDGTGSLLDLNSITSYSGGTALGSVIRASAGGHLEMKNVTSIMTGATSIESSGVGSVIDLNNLVEIDADNFASNRRLRAVDGGQILTPNLTTLGRIQLEVIGPTSSIDTADIITVNQTSLLASGGGTVELPLVTSIVHEANSVTIQADGAGSLMDLTSVTTFAGATVAGTSVQATLGGRVDLSNVVSITAGATSVTANGPGSVVDLAKLQEFAADNLASTRLLRAANGGQILTPALTTIGRVRIELDGPTSSIDLTSTTDIDEASLFARGGASLEPSAVTSMVHGSSGATVEADGVGSLVDLSGITALSGGTVVGTTVRAFNGGRVDLTGITSITAGAIDFVSSGAESVLDISNVTEYAATNMASSRRIRGEGGGTVMLRPAGTVELTNVQMSVTSDGSITGDTVALNDGTLLTGTGTIQTSIVNRAGDIRPGDAVGETSIGGDLTQESAGRI